MCVSECVSECVCVWGGGVRHSHFSALLTVIHLELELLNRESAITFNRVAWPLACESEL